MGRLHLSLCGAGWSKDSNGSRSPGIPRSGHGGPGWATAETTFLRVQISAPPLGREQRAEHSSPVALAFRLAGSCAFGFGIPFPAACTCAAGSYHCPSCGLLSSLQASGDPKGPGSLERVVIPRVARPPTRPPRSQLTKQEQRFLYYSPGKDLVQHSRTASEGRRPHSLLRRVYIGKNQNHEQGAIFLGVL